MQKKTLEREYRLTEWTTIKCDKLEIRASKIFVSSTKVPTEKEKIWKISYQKFYQVANIEINATKA